jgi:hypothetical protein
LHVSAGLRIVVPRLEVAAVKANRSTILRSRDRFWRPADIAGAPSTVQHLLADLAKSGKLRRVRKGLYWRGTKTPLGMSPPPTDALAAEVASGKGVGPAGLSAANLLRLSTQVPRRAQIAVPARAGRSTPTVEFVSRAARTGRRSAGLDRTEVAILEVLNDLSNSELSPQESWRELRGAVMSGRVRPDRLAKAAKTEPAVTRARLSELLSDAGMAGLAAKVPPADRRVRDRALASFK